MRCFPLLSSLALVLLVGGVPSVALADIDQQLDIQPNNATQGPARDVADRWITVGQERAAEGDYTAAIAAWSQALDIYNALNDSASAGIAYDYIANAYTQLNQLDQAESTVRRRIAAARDSDDRVGEIYGLNNLGGLLLQRGQVAAAATVFQQALALAETIPHAGGIGLALDGLGQVAALQGNLIQAADYFEAATGARLEARDVLGQARSSNRLGDVYRALDRNSSAIGAYRVALRAGAEGNNRALQLDAINGLLGIYFEQDDLVNAQALLNRRIALTLSQQPADLETLTTLIWLGDYYQRTGDLATAQETYEQALGLARQLEAQPQETALVNRLIALQ